MRIPKALIKNWVERYGSKFHSSIEDKKKLFRDSKAFASFFKEVNNWQLKERLKEAEKDLLRLIEEQQYNLRSDGLFHTGAITRCHELIEKVKSTQTKCGRLVRYQID